MRASDQGYAEVDQRRKERGWSRSSWKFAQAAHISVATLKRFWSGSEVSESTLISIFKAVKIDDWQNYIATVEWTSESMSHPVSASPPSALYDGVPHYPFFYGRSADLTLLQDWVLHQPGRVVTLLGMGGIGKTALAAHLTERLRPEFEAVIWRSLRSAPALSPFLADILETLAEPPESDHIHRLMAKLTQQLRHRRILLVLDGWEELFGGKSAGAYRPEYADYNHLFCHFGEQSYSSCVVITSREKPINGTIIGGFHTIKNLENPAAFQLLNRKGLSHFTPSEGERLVQLYGGNPLALQLVASTIRQQFQGNISQFLHQHSVLLDEWFIQTVLEQQMRHLSALERQMLHTLAQEALVDREVLQVCLPAPVSSSDFSNGLASLERRSLLERVVESEQVLYTLQPMVRQYVQRYLSCEAQG